MNRTRFIYYVFGDSGAVRYVGIAFNPRQRLRDHLSTMRIRAEARAGLYAFQQWLHAETMAGRKVYVCTVRPAADDWRRDEQAEITRLTDAGVPLLNVETTDAGKVRRSRRVHVSHPGPKKDHVVHHVRLPVELHEHAEIKRRAGKMTITAYIRSVVGLQPRKAGRPPRKLSR